MSCNGCRVLRRGCSETCILKPCLQWIDRDESQGHATIFVAKFFGRTRLMSLISAVPEHQRPALFQSLLFEACGRTVNPVNGAVWLLFTGKWHICQAAVEKVLRGGTLKPMPELAVDVSSGNGKSFLSNNCSSKSRVSWQKQEKLVEEAVGADGVGKSMHEVVDLDLRLSPRTVLPSRSQHGPRGRDLEDANKDDDMKLLKLFI